MLAIQAVVFYFNLNGYEANLDFMALISQPSMAYMFVIGILVFLNYFGYFVKNGVTRRDYFIGSAIAAGGVAFSINIIGAITTVIIYMVGALLNSWEMDMIDPFLKTKQVISLSLILYGYYIAGWIVAAGFYGFSRWYKSASIAIAVLYAGIINLIWKGEMTIQNLYFRLDLPPMIAIILVIIMIVLGLTLIRKATKQMPVKID
ncbi:hypothetical protein PRVXT_000396 [Proteinivorax tanatarense]|uniref:Uncharacterized protein n=1 Tax=Proteinivorax tanatarense TaxID=1260629 RepID=A0AAU7VN67_9FIRM